MVKLTKIYTRGGDAGETSLADGKRRLKNDPRITAYGSVDEANAAVGLARLSLDGPEDEMLARIQNDLFDLGADLSTPENRKENATPALRIQQIQIDRLEQEIDVMNAELAPLTSFVLPGGCESAAQLHLARTIVRRAERDLVTLIESEQTNPLALKYLNRLSDHLFVLSRHVNAKHGSEILWQPGQNL